MKSRYSARRMLKPVNFYCNAPEARSVEISGDFIEWRRVRMVRQVDGCWFIQFPLCHGHHQYRFVIDGAPAFDPSAAGKAYDVRGEPVSIVAVS